jgi:hypothetical protein
MLRLKFLCYTRFLEAVKKKCVRYTATGVLRTVLCQHRETSTAVVYAQVVQHILMWSVTREVLHFLGRGNDTIKLHKIFLPLNQLMDFSSPFYKLANDVYWLSGPRWSRSSRARKNVCWNIDDWFSFNVVLQYFIIIIIIIIIVFC